MDRGRTQGDEFTFLDKRNEDDMRMCFCFGSSLANLIRFFEEVTMVIEGRAVNVIHIKFSKTFDEYPHDLLIQKIVTNWLLGCWDSELAYS